MDIFDFKHDVDDEDFKAPIRYLYKWHREGTHLFFERDKLFCILLFILKITPPCSLHHRESSILKKWVG